MTKRDRAEYEARTTLQKAGWDVQKQDSVKFNGGSETRSHAHAKLTVAWYLKYECGFRVDTEVEMGDGEVDVVAWEEDDIVVVEVETSPTDDVVKDKIGRYVKGQPPRECWLLNVGEIPSDIHEAYEHIANKIGL